MTVKQKRAFAYALACSAIAASVMLWGTAARSRLALVAAIEYSAESSLPIAAEDKAPAPPATSPSAVPLRIAPAQKAHPAADSFPPPPAPAASQAQEELRQWELQESFALSIPALSVRAPVYVPSMRFWAARAWDDLERQMQVGLLSGVVAYPHSVAPGAKGTLIIAGHSSPPSDRALDSRFGGIFARLPEMALRDRIVLRAGGSQFTYEVIGTKVVQAGDTAILAQQKEESLLTLITCYPIGSTKERLVVIARLVTTDR